MTTQHRAFAWRRIAYAILLAVLAGAAPAVAQNAAQPAPQPASIDRNGVLILVRNAILALDQANSTGNYTVLRDLGAPAFREANDAAKLASIFSNLRGMNLDLSAVLVLDPQLTLLPQIEPNGMMHMAGFFPSVPAQVNFELLFAPVDGRWKIFGISVNVASSAPAAPPSAPPPAASAGEVPVPSKRPATEASKPAKP